jgi:hypothetical protein
MSVQVDPWESGNPYGFFMGRWSRPVAHKFLDWLSIPEHQRWLDVGCGTAVLGSSILEEKGIVAVFGSTSGTYNGKLGLVPENRIGMPSA